MKYCYIKLVILFICLVRCEDNQSCFNAHDDKDEVVSCGSDCSPENCHCGASCDECGVDWIHSFVWPMSNDSTPEEVFDYCKGCTQRPSVLPICRDPSKDNCDYKAGEMCGDTCQRSLDDCSCGEETFNIRKSQMFCCNGTKQKLNEPCQGLNGPACYNSYQDSQFLGYNAHFSCPETCVPLLDMCQGMSFCEEDVKVCNENLTVPSSIQFTPENTFYGKLIEKKPLTTSKAPRHHYYIQNAEGKINNGQYDIIDRSDEDLTDTKVETIDYTKLRFCRNFLRIPGVQCNENDQQCIPRSSWCNDSPKPCG